jgi:predicted enzyme related to lactoylglutathione lyase
MHGAGYADPPKGAEHRIDWPGMTPGTTGTTGPLYTSFCRFDLRTTDADAARAFYARILGHDRAVVWPLHEQARARGAQPHWLGQLGVADVEGVSAAFVERGAQRLGPTRPGPDGGQVAVLRDPGGAVVALGTPPATSPHASVGVVWHVLNTNDAARATENYRDLFGWTLTGRIEAGADGTFQQFAWQAGGESVGAIADIAARPHVHPHWLFFFEVDALDTALDATRAAGGVVALEPLALPGGQRIAVCDDPQGAAFGLRERSSR